MAEIIEKSAKMTFHGIYVIHMKKIVSGKKYENGIQVFFTDSKEGPNAFFSYTELIDLNINALDVIQNPGNYRYNENTRKIEMPYRDKVGIPGNKKGPGNIE
jgi:hypothetical protein